MEARVRSIFERHQGLRELAQEWEWMEAMLARIVLNRLRPGSDVKTKLHNLSRKEAGIIGASLASSIATNLTAHSAVDEWIVKYPAMRELDRK